MGHVGIWDTAGEGCRRGNCPLHRMLDFSLDTYGCNHFNELSLAQLELVADSAEIVFNRHTQELITARMPSWTSFVRGELIKGGGKLFQYIAKEDQALPKIDLSKFGGKEARGIRIMILMVHARNYDYNYCCQHIWGL